MIPAFALHRPTSAAEASQLMGRHERAAFYNGGTELTLLLKRGQARFDHLIDLKRIDELKGIEHRDGELRIGAAVTHAEIEHSPLIARLAPGLARLERVLANVRVRNTGTLGGNLCYAEPHGDPVSFLLAWGAELELARDGERRRHPVDGFIVAPFRTQRAPDEVLTAILLPDLPANTSVMHEKIAFTQRPAATAAARLSLVDGRFRDARVAVGSVGQMRHLVPEAAAVVEGADASHASEAFSEAARVAAQHADAEADLNGSIAYKRRLIEVLVRRALDTAAREVVARA